MLFRCCDHGPDVVDDDRSNPTLALEGENFYKAVESAERRDCPVGDCDQYAYTWLTQEETTAWALGQRVFPHNEFGEVIVGGWTLSLTKYRDQNRVVDYSFD